jgi:hypothetical protein
VNDKAQAPEAEVVPPSSDLSTISSLGDVMNTGQLRGAIKTAETQRALIKEFVKNQLVEGVDYGKIVGNKPTLLKPGQEKIFSLMKLTSRLEKDTDTLAMLGNEPGTVAYLCRVYRGGEEIAQGRGAAVVGDKKRDANSTVKIAEKRARMDACLSLGFSEFFTQDMDDPDYRGSDNGSDEQQARPASIKQKNYISSLFLERGINTPNKLLGAIKANGIDPPAMTTDQASDLIEKLLNKTAKLEPDTTDPEVSDEEREYNEEVLGQSKGPGDPDAHGYPGQPTDDEMSEEAIAAGLEEAERKLLEEDES